jgi:hypothetical protein
MLCGMRYLFRLKNLREFAGEFPHGLRNSLGRLFRVRLLESGGTPKETWRQI